MQKLLWTMILVAVAGCASPHPGTAPPDLRPPTANADLAGVDLAGADLSMPSTMCAPGFHACGAGCLPDGQCCTPNDCPSPPNSMATCTAGKCGVTCSPGFKACNNACIVMSQCCAALDCTPPPHVATTTCTMGSCGLGSCASGFYDLNGSYADGCECADQLRGRSCAGATYVGSFALGASQLVSGNLPQGGIENWFAVDFQSNTASNYHPRVRLTTNPNNGLRLDVFADCNNTPQTCLAEGGNATSTVDWEVATVGGDPTNRSLTYVATPAVGSGGRVLVRVFRVTGPVDCQPYTLTISN